jgi:dephospho-CoA kinase
LRRDLEKILHPLIQADMEQRAAAAIGPYLVLAIPLLVESGSDAHDRVDRILVIDVDEATQLQRIVDRDAGTFEQARAILQAQASRASRINAADDVLMNAGTVPELRQSVDRLHEYYLRLADAIGPLSAI